MNYFDALIAEYAEDEMNRANTASKLRCAYRTGLDNDEMNNCIEAYLSYEKDAFGDLLLELSEELKTGFLQAIKGDSALWVCNTDMIRKQLVKIITDQYDEKLASLDGDDYEGEELERFNRIEARSINKGI